MKTRYLLILVLIGLVASPMMAQGYKLGDVVINDDGSRGVVFYINPDGSGGWMVALTDASTGCAWGSSDDIPALVNQSPSFNQQFLYDTDGYGNTEKIRAYQNNSNLYAAGKVDFAHGWYLPSAGQLRKLFGNLAKIEGNIAAVGGSTLSTSAYWSSTEKDASHAWIVVESGANYGLFFSDSNKTNNISVRAIHDFGGGHTIVYDTTLYYYWNTGATTPYIEVSPSQTTTYTVTATTEFGCSATAEQTVFVNPSDTEHVYDTVCAGYAYNDYGFVLTPEQTQTQGEASFSRDIGEGECTATLTLHLFKQEATTGPTITASICENEAYYYNGYAYFVPGTYQQYYTAASGCDSIVQLQVTLGSPETPILEGKDNVYVATDLLTGIYQYEANLASNVTHYEWSLSGVDWPMDTLGTSCTLTVLYPGTGILTLRVWNECGSSEIQKVINAGFYDVMEQEMVLVNVYPNPARHMAVVESEGIIRIRMYSIMGQLLQEISGNSDDRVEISLRGYAPAPYMLEVMTCKGLANVKLNVVR
jgi:hypothetical protein